MDSQLEIAQAILKLAEAIDNQTKANVKHQKKLRGYCVSHEERDIRNEQRQIRDLELREKDYAIRLAQIEQNATIQKYMERFRKD